ncbi:hypothetical protein M405DRAFT_839769 [Rhizopogon salebrosus TDB-379]|nr:hypothetical protein M405DRAFT_839769 [Rhizopogon salebrosus TDB-379]
MQGYLYSTLPAVKTCTRSLSLNAHMNSGAVYVCEALATYKLAKERSDLIPFLVHPGWVKADMGGSSAKLEAHESVAGIVQVVTHVTAKDAGRFIDYTGQTVPW